MKTPPPSHVKIRLGGDGTSFAGETLWALPVANSRFRLANSPFCTHGFAEGDIVSACLHGSTLHAVSVVEHSGNGTLWLAFPPTSGDDASEVLAELRSVGCTYERASVSLVSVTVPPECEVSLSQILAYLDSLPDEALSAWELAKPPATPWPGSQTPSERDPVP
jgi:hypothetical protein